MYYLLVFDVEARFRFHHTLIFLQTALELMMLKKRTERRREGRRRAWEDTMKIEERMECEAMRGEEQRNRDEAGNDVRARWSVGCHDGGLYGESASLRSVFCCRVQLWLVRSLTFGHVSLVVPSSFSRLVLSYYLFQAIWLEALEIIIWKNIKFA